MWNPTWNNSNWFALRYVWSGNAIVITNGTGTDTGVTNDATSNVWHTVIMTIQSWTTIVYLDGTQVFSSNTWNSWWSAFYIASYWTYTTYWFNGYIRDVSIYNRVLTADEALMFHNCVI
jgi:hypothetical protein